MQGRALPMMMTAAGTVAPAKVFVMGAGVAGLQAIATARRLGAVVTATDVRPAAKEQVESLGAKFVAVEDEEFKAAETAAGYAKEMSAEYQKKQAALVAEHIKKQDVSVTTALIPGRPAPELVSARARRLDEARARCWWTWQWARAGNVAGAPRLGEVFETGGVKIVGIPNLAGRIAADSSGPITPATSPPSWGCCGQGRPARARLPTTRSWKAALVATGGAVVHPALQAA